MVAVMALLLVGGLVVGLVWGAGAANCSLRYGEREDGNSPP